MLRIHLLQQFFGHSDPAVEEALHDTPLHQEFAHLHAGMSRLPDESTILRLRYTLEEHGLGQRFARPALPVPSQFRRMSHMANYV